MTIRIQGRLSGAVHAVLQAASRLAFCVGFGILTWVAYVYCDSAYTQWIGARVLAAESRQAKETIVPASRTGLSRRTAAPAGAILGNFEMPRLGLSYVVLEGTADKTLDRSIGRITDTALLGESGNIGIAGHRNTHFRKLEWVRRDDEIVLTVHGTKYRYRVEWARLFEPDDLEVLDASHGPAVTLVTCYPFEYVGSAPLRFIVRALPDEETRAKLPANTAIARGK